MSMMRAAMVLAVTITAGAPAADEPAAEVLVEAESFATVGGWALDPQFMDVMGSPYLLAHGLGVPVANARTEVRFPRVHHSN